MKLKITITMDNAAFEECAGEEVVRILRKLSDKVQDWPGANEFVIGLRDINGNRVGEAEVEN